MPTKALVDEEGNVVDPAPLASAIGNSAQAPHKAPDPTPRRRNSNIGTMTYTLAGALDEWAYRKRSQTSAASNAAGTNAPIDILVIIIALSVDLQAGTGTGVGGRGTGPTAELLVTDQSLPVGCCGRIRLYGRDHIKKLSGIGRGDVLRFNRIDVSKDNRNETNMSSSTGGKSTGNINTALSTVICEMRPSWSDPEAGIPFARVGLSPAAGENEIIVGDNDAFLPSLGEVVDPHTLPNAMVTLPSAIEEILSWFQKLHPHPSYGGGNISTLAFYGTDEAGVGPCRRRKLRDITNVNLLSEVVVNVVHCDAAAILSPAVVLSLGGGANKRRCNVTSVSQQKGYVATLSDGNEASDIMPLYDCRRFKAILESSISSDSTGCGRLLITNVLSRRLAASSASIAATCSSSMVLLPTPDTTIVSLSNDLLAVTGAAGSGGGGRATTISSQYWHSQSQMMHNSPGRGLGSPSGNKVLVGDFETKIVTSQILDIFIDDRNQCLSDEKTLTDSDKLASILVNSRGDRSTYRNATITIDHNSAGKDSFVVRADGNIMETLCCSCPATDLMEGKDTRAIRGDVRDLLRGFIHVDIPLEWTLRKEKERETGRWTVVDVTLPKIYIMGI